MVGASSSWLMMGFFLLGRALAVVVMVLVVALPLGRGGAAEAASWCISRSTATERTLQKALDYACGAGADCGPILPDGVCYLPNTVQSHAAYAFNSYYQMKGKGSASCDFSGLAVVAMSDPSYGSCVYPSSASNSGGATSATPTTTTTNSSPNTPTTSSPVTASPVSGGVGGFSPVGPMIPNAEPSGTHRLSFSQMPVSKFLPLLLPYALLPF